MKTPRHEHRGGAELHDRAVKGRRALAMKAVIAVLVTAGAAGWSAPGSAQMSIGMELPLADLEKAFWICDHAATSRRLDTSDASACASLTEALKQRKFDGDFKAMLAWWRLRKEAEHMALTQANGTAQPRTAPAASP